MADWKNELDEWLEQEQQQHERQALDEQENRKATELNRKKAIEFIQTVARPALKELEKGLQERGMSVQVHIEPTGTSTTIEVTRQAGVAMVETTQFQYTIEAVYSSLGVVIRDRKGRKHSIDQVRKEDIISDFMQAYHSTFSLPA